MCLGAQSAIKSVRRRYLIERVGYVELKPVNRKRRTVGFAVAFVIAAVAAYAAARQSFQPKGMLVMTATGMGLLTAMSGQSLRFMIGGALVALFGAALAWLGVQAEPGMSMLFGFAGLLALVSGTVVFWRFMRTSGESAE